MAPGQSRSRVGGLFSLSGPAGSLIGAVAGGSLGQRFGLLSGFRVLAALYAVHAATPPGAACSS